MREYIERQKVIDITAETGALETQRRVQELPVADVVPVVHAKWEFNGICTSCSACGSNKPTKAHDHKLASREVRFCYFCGAKMDLEESK